MVDVWSVEPGTNGARQTLPAARPQVRHRDGALAQLVKRGLDILFALSALVAMSWLFALIAGAIAATSPGPILFRQRRSGLNGRAFTIYKFRTMTVTEDDDRVTHALRDDPRLTPIGGPLRRTSLDELPQVFNILKGDMSFVGPRPHAVAHDRHYGALVQRYAERFSVRPGLTGLAQVRGLRGEIRKPEDMVRRVDADIEYIEAWSLPRDLVIMAWTLPLLLARTNAH